MVQQSTVHAIKIIQHAKGIEAKSIFGSALCGLFAFHKIVNQYSQIEQIFATRAIFFYVVLYVHLNFFGRHIFVSAPMRIFQMLGYLVVGAHKFLQFLGNVDIQGFEQGVVVVCPLFLALHVHQFLYFVDDNLPLGHCDRSFWAERYAIFLSFIVCLLKPFSMLEKKKAPFQNVNGLL
jgi:hypothetical protein